jgi:hypothetical protein
MHRRCASSLVSGASGFMISRKWHRIALETTAVLVFLAGHTRTTSERKNCGDLQTTKPRERGHNPTDAIGRSGLNRKTRSFSSAGGTGICSLLSRPCLIAASDRQPLRGFLCTSSRAAHPAASGQTLRPARLCPCPVVWPLRHPRHCSFSRIVEASAHPLSF